MKATNAKRLSEGNKCKHLSEGKAMPSSEGEPTVHSEGKTSSFSEGKSKISNVGIFLRILTMQHNFYKTFKANFNNIFILKSTATGKQRFPFTGNRRLPFTGSRRLPFTANLRFAFTQTLCVCCLPFTENQRSSFTECVSIPSLEAKGSPSLTLNFLAHITKK